jgi:drug/metabolite transporter (DMT)-like permease
MKIKPWVLFTAITTLLWGVWGALIEIPEKAGFPATLGYCVWALTMIPCAVVALGMNQWRLDRDRRSVLIGSAAGLLGALGQLLLFEALRSGPAYMVFPIVSLFPVVTVGLSSFFLREKTSLRQKIGVFIALLAIFCLSYQPASTSSNTGYSWLILSAIVFLMWGLQAFAMKWGNNVMSSESIFFYMTVSALALIPLAIGMTDGFENVNMGFTGPYLAALIQILNAIGALTLVYALRDGKAVIVVPVTALAPVLTVIISLVLYRVIPNSVVITGIILATASIYVLSE